MDCFGNPHLDARAVGTDRLARKRASTYLRRPRPRHAPELVKETGFELDGLFGGNVPDRPRALTERRASARNPAVHLPANARIDVAALEQIIEPADAIPPIPVALEQ